MIGSERYCVSCCAADPLGELLKPCLDCDAMVCASCSEFERCPECVERTEAHAAEDCDNERADRELDWARDEGVA